MYFISYLIVYTACFCTQPRSPILQFLFPTCTTSSVVQGFGILGKYMACITYFSMLSSRYPAAFQSLSLQLSFSSACQLSLSRVSSYKPMILNCPVLLVYQVPSALIVHSFQYIRFCISRNAIESHRSIFLCTNTCITRPNRSPYKNTNH
jgi:hypothetical protein